jgi:hypothetical protein
MAKKINDSVLAAHESRRRLQRLHAGVAEPVSTPVPGSPPPTAATSARGNGEATEAIRLQTFGGGGGGDGGSGATVAPVSAVHATAITEL